MLDTDTLIYVIKNKPIQVGKRLDAMPDDDAVCMSFITYAELLKGVQRSQRKKQTLLNLDRLTRQIPVVHDTNRALCEHYAEQFTRLKLAGTPIGANDLWIACHALALNATIVTNNVNEFERIVGLKIENWVH
jgi:tRNA(fMet)-specific endonuclease VapC